MIETDYTPQEWLLPEADASTVLDIAAESVLFSREADRLKVRTVLKWCELHPASPEDAATWGEADGSGCDTPINRDGAPAVQASCIAELAAKFEMTTAAAYYLVDACLELRWRLPRLFARFEALQVDFFRLRNVTRLTEGLSPAAAAYVDQQLAPIIGKVGRRKVEDVVARAIALFDPEAVEEKTRAGKARWHVNVHHPEVVDFASTSDLSAAADSLDLEDFMAGLSMVAEDLARDGAPDDLGQRRAKALGIIGRKLTGRAEHPSPDQRPEPAQDEDEFVAPADPGQPADQPEADRAADLAADGEPGPGAAAEPERPTTTPAPGLGKLTQPRSPHRRRNALTVHAHLHTDAVSGLTKTVYEIPRLGVVGEEAFTRWQQTHGVKVTRIIDLNRHHAVDQHDPPPAMRAQVMARDRHCVFPGCEVPAESCDLDHIVPYRDPGRDDYTSGQTNPDALACLCRMHHLLKTHSGWSYGRLSDAAYLWVSPRGRCYRVDSTGTHWDLVGSPAA